MTREKNRRYLTIEDALAETTKSSQGAVILMGGSIRMPRGLITAVREFAEGGPLRMPHHSASRRGMLGELQLAGDGVLYLDEANLIPWTTLDAVAQEFNRQGRRPAIFGSVRYWKDRVGEATLDDARTIARKFGVPLLSLEDGGSLLQIPVFPLPAEPAAEAGAPQLAPEGAPQPKPPRKESPFAPRPKGEETSTPASPFGVCRRCAVCLRWDVAQGCCTVCGRPLSRAANPSKLKRRLIGARGTNPFIRRHASPRFVVGDEPILYRYSDYHIELWPERDGTWRVELERVTPGALVPGSIMYIAPNEHAALKVAKMAVDFYDWIESLGPDRDQAFNAWGLIDVAANELDRSAEPVTRATVSRTMETIRHEMSKDAAYRRAYTWFDALPLEDRLQLIDRKIDIRRLEGRDTAHAQWTGARAPNRGKLKRRLLR